MANVESHNCREIQPAYKNDESVMLVMCKLHNVHIAQ